MRRGRALGAEILQGFYQAEAEQVEAERQAKVALSRQLALEVGDQLDQNNVATALLLAVEAGRTAETVEEVAGAHDNALALPCDVTDAAGVDAAFDKAVESWGRIDALFNNAGVAFGGELRDLGPKDWDAWMNVIDVNLMGVINGIRAVYPHMVERGRGQIVNTSSAAGISSTSTT